MFKIHLFKAFLFLALLGAPLWGEVWEGRAVKVIDGNTFVVLRDHQQVKVRFVEISAPEEGKPWSWESKEALKSQIIGKIVTIDQKGIDFDGIALGVVWQDQMNVNRWMVQNGHARVIRKYMSNYPLAKLEQRAKKHQRGMWAKPDRDEMDIALW